VSGTSIIKSGGKLKVILSYSKIFIYFRSVCILSYSKIFICFRSVCIYHTQKYLLTSDMFVCFLVYVDSVDRKFLSIIVLNFTLFLTICKYDALRTVHK